MTVSFVVFAMKAFAGGLVACWISRGVLGALHFFASLVRGIAGR